MTETLDTPPSDAQARAYYIERSISSVAWDDLPEAVKQAWREKAAAP